MKEYNLNIDEGRARIRVYIQLDEYTGFFERVIIGNIKGRAFIDNAIDVDILEQQDITKSNCKLRVKDNYYFSCELKNKKGDILEIEEDLDFLSRIIVGCKIIEFQKYEEKNTKIS